MEAWKEIWSLEDSEAVQLAAAQTLQNSGINLPLGEASNTENAVPTSHGAFFGVSLECDWQPTLAYCYNDSSEFQLPRFFVEAVRFLECHSTREGIFRKAGSVTRQKALKATLDSGNPSIPPDSNVHDVACLLKQYLRELPEPLITSHLLPVFEACYSLPSPTDRQRCMLLACLLLPQMHLQCLCVLMKLLHCVSESCSESLMDASNLAIVLAPNIIRPNISFITPAQGGNPFKNQAAIVQLLIESSRWIGCVPPEVCSLSETIRGDLAHTPGIETVLGGAKGHDLPSRYLGNKDKKQRTSSLSGLVLGLGNRLLSKGSVASESCDNHMTTVQRRTSIKRHSSADDLLCNESTKRRATQLNSASRPHPPASAAFTPDQPHKHKRRHLLLSRHRHSSSRRNKSSSKSSRFNFSQQKFFNFRFTPKPAPPDASTGSTSHTNEILPTQQFVYRGQDSDEVEGHSYKSKLLIDHGHTPSTTTTTATEQQSSSSQVKSNVFISVSEPESKAITSSQNHTDRTLGGAAATFDATKANVATTVGLALSNALNPAMAVCTVPHVPSDRPTKKVKCDIKWGEDDSISDRAKPSLKIPTSRSDFTIEDGAEKIQTTAGQSPFKFLTPKGIPSSKSHPTFPFSQPRQCGQQGVKFPFVDAQNDCIEKASFPFTPHLGGTSKNFQFLDPQNDSIQKASFPLTPYPSLKPSKTPPPDDLYTYSFANPTPLNPHTLTSRPLVSDREASLVGEKSVVQNLNKAFVNDSQFNDDSFPSGSIDLPTVVRETTPSTSNHHAHKGNANAKAAVLRRLSSIHGKAGALPLDDAFLQTPFPLSTHSPNLLEKITSEIALRHKFSPPPPNGSSSSQAHPPKSVPNTGSSCISSEGNSLAKEDTSDREEQMESGDDGGAILGTGEKEMFKRLVLRVNDSYKKAMEGDEGEHLLPQGEESDAASVASSASSKDNEAMDVARSKSEDSISIGGESDCFDGLLPHKLKFDSSTCDSDVSLQSSLETGATVTQQSSSAAEIKGGSLSTRVGNGRIKSPNVMKANRQLVTPRSSARRTMAYSATLGLSEQLLITRDPAKIRKSTKRPITIAVYTSSNKANTSSTSQQQVPPAHHKPSARAAALSASLGITEFNLGGTVQGEKSQKSTISVEKGSPSSGQKSATDTGACTVNLDQQKTVQGSNVDNISPTPAILHILEANGVTSQAKKSGDKPSTSEDECQKTNRQRRRMSKSKSMNSLKRSSENQEGSAKTALRKVYSNDEPVNYKFKAVGGKVESDCSVVTRAPTPRLPFGLKSPWFRLTGNKEDRTKKENQDNQEGKINRRLQPYIVNGPVKSPLKSNNENSCYHDDSHVI